MHQNLFKDIFCKHFSCHSSCVTASHFAASSSSHSLSDLIHFIVFVLSELAVFNFWHTFRPLAHYSGPPWSRGVQDCIPKMSSFLLAVAAEKEGTPVFKFPRWRVKGKPIPEVVDAYKAVGAELNVMPFCSQFIPMNVIDHPKHGSIIYHPSILPLHRGASAINWWERRGFKRSLFDSLRYAGDTGTLNKVDLIIRNINIIICPIKRQEGLRNEPFLSEVILGKRPNRHRATNNE